MHNCRWNWRHDFFFFLTLYSITYYITFKCCCAPNTTARANAPDTITRIYTLLHFQPPTSKAPSALCPCCSLRYVHPVMQKKVTVCVCECLPVFTFVLRLFHCNIQAQSAQRGIHVNLCTTFLINHSPSSLFHSLFCFFSFCLCKKATLNPCSTNYSWNRNGNTQRT